MLTEQWHKSTRSDQGNCVEVRKTGPVQVRDSKDPDGAVLDIQPADWETFLGWVRQPAAGL